MSDLNSPEAWAEIEAKELRLWLAPVASGLWCPTCLLPSGISYTVSRDPAEPSASVHWFCTEDRTHREEAP